MQRYREPAREIPIVREADVLIIGGGPAGLAAAIASARCGARTVLVERFGYLGGTATASLMAKINGFRNQVESDSLQAVRGIAEEILLEVKALDGLGKRPYRHKIYGGTPGQLECSYTIDTETFKYVTLRMCVEAGVDLLFHSYFSTSIVEDGAAEGVLVENKSGRQALMARVVIDASGDGDVAARAGVPFWQTVGDEAKRLNDGLMYRIGFGASRPEGKIGCDFRTSSVVWGPRLGPLNGIDADALSKAEIETRLKVFEDFAEKQERHPELADAGVLETPPMLGIRQTRFIEGEYRLTAKDAIEGRRFEDVVAISPCPIIQYYGYRRYLEHEGYDIPYRCLVPRGIENLLVAGRCISSDQQPYESHRAMVPVMAIGQAAGVAAALAAEEGVSPRDIDVSDLQQELIAQGAELRK